jgi:hypothetical protein
MGSVVRDVLPDAEAESWIFESLAWLAQRLHTIAPPPRPLLLPGDRFFPVPSALPAEERSQALFLELKRHTGLCHVPCEIESQTSFEPTPDDRPIVFVPAEPEPAAVFRRGFGSAPHRVAVHPELHADPMRLVAILAHGLAHAALATVPGEPPGGVDAWDAVTDLAALWLGAGVFLANAALVVRRQDLLFCEGLEVRCQGWLGPGDFALGLAIHSRLFEHAPAALRRHLRRDPRAAFDRATARLARPDGARRLGALRLRLS